MKKYIFLLTMLPAVLLFLSGCLPGSSKNKAVKTHKLKLSSYPEGATAHVAGKKFNLPYEFKMSPGSYLFRIEKPGYAPAWFSCRVQPSGITIPRTAANGSYVLTLNHYFNRVDTFFIITAARRCYYHKCRAGNGMNA